MQNDRSIRSILLLMYRETKPEIIINNIINHRENNQNKNFKHISLNYSKYQFLDIAKGYLNNFNTNQLEAIYGNIQAEIHNKFDWEPYKPESLVNREDIGVFDVTQIFASELLRETDNGVVCKFNRILFWRDLSHPLSEDLFITAFLAKKDYELGLLRENYTWPQVIKTDSVRLKNLLSSGLADNHYHLKASSPIFDWQWVHLMNHIFSSEKLQFKEKLSRIDKNPLSNNIEYSYVKYNLSFYHQVRLAAVIRILLYKWINMEDIKKLF